MAENSSPKYRTDIEGLRGIAILVVVAYHAEIPGFTGGFVGVDVFFVLSGYLITGLLFAEMEKKGTISLLDFYARRARRLLPAAATMLSITIVAAYLIFPPIQQKGLPESALSTATYISNLYFLRNATDYLGAPPETNPLLHTWSLSVEEQFYFIWPILVMFALKWGGKNRLLTVMTGVVITSFALSVWLTSYRQPWAFFSSPTRAWEFAAGALGVMIASNYSRLISEMIGWIGLLFIFAAAYLYGSNTVFPGWAVLIPVLGTIAVLRSGQETSVGQFLSTKILQFFGTLSYSWYLWHWVVLVFSKALWGDIPLPSRILCVAFALLLAQISYKFIENPIRFHPILVRHTSNALAMAAVITIFSIASALAFRSFSQKSGQFSEQKQFTDTKADLPESIKNCDINLFNSELKECVFGQSDKSMVLFGDSHASQWIPAAQRFTEVEGIQLITMFKSSCSPVDVTYTNRKIGRRFYECEQWRAKAFERINELRPDIIIMTGYLLVDSAEDDSKVSIGKWQDGLRRSLTKLNESGAQVIYIKDTPRPGFNVLECLAQREWRKGWRLTDDCTFQKEIWFNEEIEKVERETVLGNNAAYLDMNEYICPNSKCEGIHNGIIVYRDNHHLSNKFATNLSPLFNIKIKEILR